MRRIFDYNFDLLDISLAEPITLAQKPNDEPLYADIDGDSGDNTLVGTSGSDTINGFGGNDTLDGLRGTNTLTGGTGTDTFIVSARGSHNTTITDFEDGLEVIDLSGTGISSFDQLMPFMSQQGTDVRLQTIWAFNSERLTISDILLADLTASDFVFDTDATTRLISGTSQNNTFFGGLGDDVLNGGTGNEDLIGGDGDDMIDGGRGNNFVIGGAGIDTFIVSARGSHNTTITDFEDGLEVIDLSGTGISSFDQLVPFMSQQGTDVRLQTIWAFNSERLTISDILLADLTASDFVFDTDATARLISGTSQNNTFFGGLGDDVLNGGNGSEGLNGGDGNDTITGGSGNDSLRGGNGDDILSGGSGRDFIDGGAGIDTVQYFDASAGVNVNLGTGGASGSSAQGDEVLNVENIDGSDFNDTLTGSDVDNIINGGLGADRLIGGLGADTFIGGDGFDSVDYRAAAEAVRFSVDTGGTAGEALGDTFSDIERYYLSNFNDVITGSDANEFFFGEDGNDTINAGGGIDRVYGGDGNDIQRGQDGNDQLYGSAGNDQLNGGAGFDIANYGDAAEAVIVNMLTGGTGGDAAGDTYFGIEAVYGSDFDDSLTGNNSANELRGGDGDDALFGLGGNDRFFGGEGADSFDGGTGVDIVNYTVAAAGVTLDLTTSGLSGEATGDTFTSIEWVFGSNFDDDISGNEFNNRLEGRDGNDTLNGGDGNDRLLGGDGNDIINGDDGVDTIFGQDGDDIMTGGGGNDFFFGGAGADSHDGGSGIDTVSYLASSGPIVIQNGVGIGGDATGDTYSSIERYFGSSGDDVINTSGVLLGNGGDDFLHGMNGSNDSLNGGAGMDTFAYDVTGGAADVIQGFFLGEQISILGDDTNFDTEAEVMAAGTNAGSNVIFDFGLGNTITIVGFNLEDLPSNTFIFTGQLSGEPLSEGEAFAADISDVFDMDALI